MNTDHGLKAGDKVTTPAGTVYDVLEVVGRFALIQWEDHSPSPIVFDDGAWRSRIYGTPLAVVKPRWRAVAQESKTVVFDGERDEGSYAIGLWADDTDLTRFEIAEVVEAIVDLLNERFPA